MSDPNARRQRFWGPSNVNPWMNPRFVGPPRRRLLNSAPRRSVAEKRQQRAAIKAWEDEGGSLGGTGRGELRAVVATSGRGGRPLPVLRQDHCINAVNDAIRRDQIGFHDAGCVDARAR